MIMKSMVKGGVDFPHVFSPVTVGTMSLRNRVMVPPHGSAIGDLWGQEHEAERAIAYWRARARDGASWIDGVRGRVQNPLVPGFEPHGYGAGTLGNYRSPLFVERVRRFVDAMHREGATVTSQLTVIGGVPHAPSNRLGSPLHNFRPHVLSRREIDWYVSEYRFCARQAAAAGLDGIELHLNHEDLLEWFLSPDTNERRDAYGGSLENRARFAVEVLQQVRAETGPTTTLGVRFTMRQQAPGGYDTAEGVRIARHLEATGLIDFLHLVIGSSWGDPSYIQPQHYRAAQWSDLAARFRENVSLPIVYTGRVNSVEAAEEVLAAGHADVVGMGRAYIADPDLLTKARRADTGRTRPCVGGNDCISRPYAEGLPFGCAVNPHASNEVEGPWQARAAVDPRSLLVVGGGPAGMELAALAAQSGHRVQLWESRPELGGQLRTAAQAPRFDQYMRYLDWQARRLDEAGVDVRLGHTADAAAVAAHSPDTVAVATGATPHVPRIPGVHADHVVGIGDVHHGAPVGQRVLVVAQDDHLPPLSAADLLSERGHSVTVVYATTQPAQLLGRYILGAVLGRLRTRGVQLRLMEEVTAVLGDGVTVRDVYSRQSQDLTGFDSVVLACGGDSDAELYGQLLDAGTDAHVLGDAFAPRRLVFATRQAYALARQLRDTRR